MQNFRRRKRIPAWLAIIALFGNALVAALAVAPASAAPLADDVLGPLVICTSHGADAAPQDGGSSPQSPREHCPACTLLAKVALVPAPLLLAASVLPDLPAVTPMPIRLRGPAEHLGPGGIRSRAPPTPHLG